MNERKSNPMDLGFWRDLPMDKLKGFLRLGILIPSDRPGGYYLVKEIMLPCESKDNLPL